MTLAQLRALLDAVPAEYDHFTVADDDGRPFTGWNVVPVPFHSATIGDTYGDTLYLSADPDAAPDAAPDASDSGARFEGIDHGAEW